jgi:hypothetical protein
MSRLDQAQEDHHRMSHSVESLCIAPKTVCHTISFGGVGDIDLVQSCPAHQAATVARLTVTPHPLDLAAAADSKSTFLLSGTAS